jgi:hypothetical protein
MGNMPKVTITFDLPEEESEFNLCNRGPRYNDALCDLDNEMRVCVKYNNEPCWVNPRMPEQVAENDVTVRVTDHWRSRLHALLDDRGVRLWEE